MNDPNNIRINFLEYRLSLWNLWWEENKLYFKITGRIKEKRLMYNKLVKSYKDRINKLKK